MTKAKKKLASKALKAKALSDMVVTIEGEVRTNKHLSYLKVMKHEESGKHYMGAQDGSDLFYLGTYDPDLINKITDQIFNISFQGEQASKAGVGEANATLAAIIEMDPQDPTELMLAAQMTTVHNMAMRMSSRVLKGEQSIEHANFYINCVTKLMRTYTTQMEALNKYRNKGRQQITVKHQHVNVNDGGQAIVGDIKGGG